MNYTNEEKFQPFTKTKKLDENQKKLLEKI